MYSLREFAGEPLVGVLLQELAVTNAEPRLISDNGKVAVFETTLQDTKPNRNKRLYPGNVLEEAILNPRVQELIRTRTFFGEANHPFSDEPTRQMVTDQTRISHLVTTVVPPSKNGGVVKGIVETASTECGRDFRGLIVDNRSTAAFSMRGVGKVKMTATGLMEVTSPLKMSAYDWVTFPSHETAYMSTGASVMREDAITGFAPLTAKSMAQYAVDQSKNVRAIVEQFQLGDDTTFTLNEKDLDLIVANSDTKVRVFLEDNIRRDFRHAMTRLF